MFFIPQVLKRSFNRNYNLSDITPAGWNIQLVNLWGSAESFLRELNAPYGDWEQLLYSQSDIDQRHVEKSEEELVADLLEAGELRAYEVPGPDEIRRLKSVAVIDKKTGTRCMFLPGN